MFLIDWFKKVKSLIQQAFGAAEESGLTDQLVHDALTWARVAAEKFLDNADKREFVVKMLMMRGVPESIARIAVEAAVQLLKAELRKLDA